jgi:hypothetical protein
MYLLYPKEWLHPSEAWASGAFGVIALLATLIGAVCFCFVAVAGRKLARV